ncbi:MAG: efflux RND transporter periplasmic adaptor subunit [Deltaproteobacteria bacterium]|nr:efflux RND transporter periplasmic adaptor subunit [Deltaproteobacteria bacterium]
MMKKQLLLIFLLFFSLAQCKKENPDVISASGILDSTQIRISSKLGGKILKMYADEGRKIKKGDILFETDCEELRLQLLQAETNLMIAKNQYSLVIKGARREDIEQVKYSIDILETNLLIAKNDFERAKRLFEANAISQKTLEEAELKVKVIEKQIEASKQNYQKVKNISRAEEIEAARLRIESSNIAIDILKERMSDCTVTSPVDGTITKKIFNEGELIAPGSPVYLITDTSKIFLKIYLPEKEIFRIKIGDKAIIKTDADIGEFQGVVTYISDEAEFTPKTIQTKDERTKLVFMVKIEIDNVDGRLKSGLPADAYFNLKNR